MLHPVFRAHRPSQRARLLLAQMRDPARKVSRLQHVAGGAGQAMSLRQLSGWCAQQFGPHPVASDPAERPFDIPWMVMDSTCAEQQWGWRPEIALESILDEIAAHATRHPDWLDVTA